MSATPEFETIVGLLRSDSTYGDPVGTVDTVETHISWVYLTTRYAYKLKKPVRFQFLDFSTVELRRRACFAELRLNRRLAPDVYLAALPITAGADGSLSLAGSGQAVDWLVQMRRLPADKAVDQVLQRGQLTADDRQAVAERLIDFYARLASKQVVPAAYRRSIDQHVRANGDALLTIQGSVERGQIRRAVEAQLRYLHVEAETFDDRVNGGRIVEGHGDLRPEHIYLERPPVVIDCIEFSEELRSVDIADELSFLAMECERLGDGSLGEHVLAAYQDSFDDVLPERLQAFYRGYRACVRAKVAALRAQQESEHEPLPDDQLFQQYLDLADRYAAELGRPALLVIGGLMGSGKSTFARDLAHAFRTELIATDHVRRELLGASPSPARYGTGIYQPEQRRRVYDEVLRRAEELLAKGRSAIVDGTFLTRAVRDRAVGLAGAHDAIVVCVLCQCPRETSLARIDQRSSLGGSASEARADLYDRQSDEFEQPTADEPVVTVDTTEPLAEGLKAVYRELRQRLFG